MQLFRKLVPKSLPCTRNMQNKVPPAKSLIMIRHGESTWNQYNLFTGWYDCPLSTKGEKEAQRAALALSQMNKKFDIAFTSVLQRANKTLCAILRRTCNTDIPIIKSWRLNERHYGALTGLNKSETAKKYGEAQVKIWRRSYDIPPPPMTYGHPYLNPIKFASIYRSGPKRHEFPWTESLSMTLDRTMPFWTSDVLPALKKGKRVIIAAHGNSLRAIIKSLYDMSSEEIIDVNLPTGIPFKVLLNSRFQAVGKMEFLGDKEMVQEAMEKVAAQGKSK